MTQPTLQQSHGPQYTRILVDRSGTRRPRRAERRPRRPDQLLRRVDPPAHRASSPAPARAMTCSPSTSRPTPRREAIAKSGVDPKLIDAVIVATISNSSQTPSMAAVLADRVGANPAAAYDMNAACAGYAYAIAQADALIRTGVAHYALVVGAEKLSDVVDPTDRTISFLLGDGAGAVVIGPSEFPGISKTIWGSDGSKAGRGRHGRHARRVPRRRGAVADPPPGGPDGLPLGRLGDGQGRQAGPGCRRRHAATSSPRSSPTRRTCASSTSSPSSSSCRRPSSIARDIETTGNTSAASIPLATHRLLEEHPELVRRTRPADRLRRRTGVRRAGRRAALN